MINSSISTCSFQKDKIIQLQNNKPSFKGRVVLKGESKEVLTHALKGLYGGVNVAEQVTNILKFLKDCANSAIGYTIESQTMKEITGVECKRIIIKPFIDINKCSSLDPCNFDQYLKQKNMLNNQNFMLSQNIKASFLKTALANIKSAHRIYEVLAGEFAEKTLHSKEGLGILNNFVSK